MALFLLLLSIRGPGSSARRLEGHSVVEHTALTCRISALIPASGRLIRCSSLLFIATRVAVDAERRLDEWDLRHKVVPRLSTTVIADSWELWGLLHTPEELSELRELFHKRNDHFYRQLKGVL